MNAQTRSFQRLFDFNKPSWLKRIMQHLELIAALTSGLLIAVAWYLDHQQLELASIILYLSAYIIGGYAKAKEGIQSNKLKPGNRAVCRKINDRINIWH